MSHLKIMTQPIRCSMLLALAVGPAWNAPAQKVDPSSFRVVSRGPHERVWSRETGVPLPSGRIIKQAQTYTDLESGLHYWKDGQWMESQEILEEFQDGVIGRQSPCSVILAPDLNSPAAVDLVLPEGERLQSTILGIGVFDSATGRSELLAEVKSSVGQLHRPNQVLYPDAFDGLKADVIYTYRKNAFIQDIVLNQQVVLPDGFRRESSRLEIWTEFNSTAKPARSGRIRAGMEDEAIDFGSARFGEGKAFANERPAGSVSIPVFKQWILAEGRSFLVEAVRFEEVEAELNRLGVAQAVRRGPAGAQVAAIGKNARPFPKARVQMARAKDQKIEVASAARPAGGLTIDYDLQMGYGSLVLQADSTYNLVGNVNVTNLLIEGGTVVKRSSGALQVAWGGTIETRTDPYRVAVFTSKDDNSVGTAITGSTGTPSPPQAGSPFLHLVQPSQLSHVRFSYGYPAIYCDFSSGQHQLTHAQFVHCPSALWLEDGATFYLGDVLMYDLDTAIYGSGFSGSAVHLTVHDCGDFVFDAYASAPVALTNSLFVNVTNWGNASITTNATVKVTSSNVFQTVGAASHYLSATSVYRDLGSTNIDAGLLADIRKMTTHPPVVIEPATIYTNNLNLTPQAQRDTDTPDLGAHYWPLDYVLGGLALTNATITASNGVAIGTWSRGGYSVALFENAAVVSAGLPERPNWFVRYNTVQEQATTNWITSSVAPILQTAPTSLSSPPRVSMRFTHFSVLAQDAYHFQPGYSDPGAHDFTHSEFHGGKLISGRASLAFTNCLMNRVNTALSDDFGSYDPSHSFLNCTFYGGTNVLEHYGTGTWLFKNNLLAESGTLQDGNVTASYNGYTTNLAALTPSIGASNVLYASSSVGFEVGSFGRFYLPTNSVFIGKGSTNAQHVGLYHFTVLSTNLKETNSIVDLGYHRVAVDGTGHPADGDGDGVPDYLEDVDGDGVVDTGENNWQSYNSQNNLSGMPGLQVFTPLK